MVIEIPLRTERAPPLHVRQLPFSGPAKEHPDAPADQWRDVAFAHAILHRQQRQRARRKAAIEPSRRQFQRWQPSRHDVRQRDPVSAGPELIQQPIERITIELTAALEIRPRAIVQRIIVKSFRAPDAAARDQQPPTVATQRGKIALRAGT
jgi:hypothetical protein